jgi:hypothetical protein
MAAYYLTVNGGTGSGYHNSGQPFGVGAIVPTGYSFHYWGGANPETLANINAANTTCTIYGNASITAFFQRTVYTIAYTANAGGSITGDDSQNLYYGAVTSSVTATPAIGYDFDEWSDGNKNPTRHDTCSGSVTYRASFKVNAPPAPDGNIYPGNITWM